MKDLLAGGPGFPYGLSHKIPPEGETQIAYSVYDAAPGSLAHWPITMPIASSSRVALTDRK
jgi:hypothetical protein